ncbi:MAG: acetylglutamate kinase [Planctomycetota bacterium]
MRLCVKIGGAQLEEAGARAVLARAIASARDAGHEIVLVHGGGNQIRALCRRLGIEDRYHDGLRITDAATATVATQVLCGEVNKALVQSLGESAVRAVGMCGADGAVFTARRHQPDGHDLGYVGVIHRVDRSVVDALLAAGFTPTLATLAPLDPDCEGPRDHLYNINADHAAAPIAAALGCDAMLFLTDVPGVLDADRQRIAALSPEDCVRLRAEGVLTGGMIPKVDAALGAVTALPSGLVKIAPAAGADAVLAALSDEVGTRFAPTTC